MAATRIVAINAAMMPYSTAVTPRLPNLKAIQIYLNSNILFTLDMWGTALRSLCMRQGGVTRKEC